jgi:tRNA-methyltransferase O
MFTPQPIGFVRSPYTGTKQIPKGLGTKHEADGVLEIQPEFERGLADIEGFSHLFVIWVFDRSQGVELVGAPPSDNRPHGVFATRSRSAQTQSASPSSNCCAVKAECFTFAVSTCSTARPSSISSPTCQASRRKN